MEQLVSYAACPEKTTSGTFQTKCRESIKPSDHLSICFDSQIDGQDKGIVLGASERSEEEKIIV